MTSLTHEESEPIYSIDCNDGHNTLQGTALKRHLRFYNYLSPCFGPEWVERYLVLRGFYLYRYTAKPADEQHVRCKGTPIPVSDMQVEAIDDDTDEDGIEVRPYCLRISTLRKTYYFAMDSNDERKRWMQELMQQKQKVIKQKLGHQQVEDWEQRSNHVGDRLVSQNERVEQAETDMMRQQQTIAGY